MASFRYDTTGQWYKGNTHIHSTLSDGGKSPEELWAIYAGLGYDFLFHTDHNVASQFERKHNADAAPLLVLDGIEIDGHDDEGAYFHVVCLGSFAGMEQKMPLMAGMKAVREQNGIMILAHPHWSGNTFDDALRHGFDGVEVYNNVCLFLNAKSDGEAYWDAMLKRQGGVLGFAADDCHCKAEFPQINGGWIVVNTPARTREAIMAAIRRGNFYSSRGPQFHSIQSDGTHVHFTSSPAVAAHLIGPAWEGLRLFAEPGQAITEHTWELPKNWPYMRLRIEDNQGRPAWSNTLFRD